MTGQFSKFWLFSLLFMAVLSHNMPTQASEFFRPWSDKNRALVLDGYEFNELDLVEISKNKRIAAFIHKGSDGLSPPYSCNGNEPARALCREKWRRYSVAKELYHTRRALAKALGLKWGAYHLGRPGNPIAQAQHFLNYTDPSDDEALVIDIEANDPDKWMSLEDAEIFARYIADRTGRWPMLYTNGSTSKFIADNRESYPILSRLPLWYARFKPEIRGHFPKGNWDSYDIWQFGSRINCDSRSCLYRVSGANDDIDVNVVDMSVEALKAAWPMGTLKEPALPEVLPIPMARPDTAPASAMIASLEEGEPKQSEINSHLPADLWRDRDSITTSSVNTIDGRLTTVPAGSNATMEVVAPIAATQRTHADDQD